MKAKQITYRGIKLIRVEKTDVVIFNSYLEKEQMIADNNSNGNNYCDICCNHARVYLYIAVDMETGCALNTEALNYYQIKGLVDMYL